MIRNMHTNPAAAYGPLKLREILHRIALPLLLFLAVLTGVLMLSWWMLLPRWTQVNIAGSVMGPREATEYLKTLEADVEAREKSRLAVVIPVRDELYAALRDVRASLPEMETLRQTITDAARRGSPEDVPNAVAVDAVAFHADNRTLTVSGAVGGVGPRSITVLAYFTDILRQLPFAESVTPPEFGRVEDEKAGFYSPFTITIALKNTSVSAE